MLGILGILSITGSMLTIVPTFLSCVSGAEEKRGRELIASFTVPGDPAQTGLLDNRSLIDEPHSTVSSTPDVASTPSLPVISASQPTERLPAAQPKFPVVNPVEQDHEYYRQFAGDSQLTVATTMVTDTDFLGNLITTSSTFVLEPSLRAFQSCIFGCSSVTIPVSSDTGATSTVIVILPLTIPCSLVKCPPCNTCISSTVSITVCPVVTTLTPTPATATIFTAPVSIATEKCQAMIKAAVGALQASAVTVTRTRTPIGCPGLVFADADNLPVTQTATGPSACSTFVVCKAKRFTCPLEAPSVEGTHLIDTFQAVLSTPTLTSDLACEPAVSTAVAGAAGGAAGTIAEKMLQKNGARSIRSRLAVPLVAVLIVSIFA